MVFVSYNNTFEDEKGGEVQRLETEDMKAALPALRTSPIGANIKQLSIRLR